MTLTTYDEDLCRILEPNVSTTRERFETLMILKELGIPTIVWLSPILPYINDTRENIEGILDYCIRANVYGIMCFGIGMTLRDGNREYFYSALDRHFPGVREKYQTKYGYSYEIASDNQKELTDFLRKECQNHHIVFDRDALFSYLHEYPESKGYEQLSLFSL